MDEEQVTPEEQPQEVVSEQTPLEELQEAEARILAEEQHQPDPPVIDDRYSRLLDAFNKLAARSNEDGVFLQELRKEAGI